MSLINLSLMIFFIFPNSVVLLYSIHWLVIACCSNDSTSVLYFISFLTVYTLAGCSNDSISVLYFISFLTVYTLAGDCMLLQWFYQCAVFIFFLTVYTLAGDCMLLQWFRGLYLALIVSWLLYSYTSVRYPPISGQKNSPWPNGFCPSFMVLGLLFLYNINGSETKALSLIGCMICQHDGGIVS